ncbi:IS30 family transposase [Actinomycetaceae bacterium WB03_NA08]|uniref:IS30 family transposase n=1 Tax=Scrofimicrobium canadense TaxID=2652290 RepID=A0A6N7WAA9_9ACTO|nr:IS30 family transposase [Scrofimicrobium canadense]MSS85176.1 IS30 family transposase [Scrofimicrobium canadense]
MSTGYRHLCLDVRFHIEKLVDQGISIRQVAASLGRAPSTICREVRRNGWRPSSTSQAYVPYRPASLKCGPYTRFQYRASIAQGKAETASGRSHMPWRMSQDDLVDYVVQHLRRGWTPEMIAGRLLIDYPLDRRMRICAESIYQWVCSTPQKWRELAQYLPKGHKRRRKRGGRKVHSKTRIPDRTSIHERAGEVEDRLEFGHWEGDSVIGGGHSGAIHTEVERKTRYLSAVLLSRYGAKETLAAQLSLFTALPEYARKTVTTDNGSEFTDHAGLHPEGIKTFFADPYSS